ncbi:hypothetical protein [Synergistes jonesii]|uniref:hypothetical protein n=1 Tax=Synergistes jonesii TaxID=2754 RepID=UPI003320FF5A
MTKILNSSVSSGKIKFNIQEHKEQYEKSEYIKNIDDLNTEPTKNIVNISKLESDIIFEMVKATAKKESTDVQMRLFRFVDDFNRILRETRDLKIFEEYLKFIRSSSEDGDFIIKWKTKNIFIYFLFSEKSDSWGYVINNDLTDNYGSFSQSIKQDDYIAAIKSALDRLSYNI